MNIHIDIIAPNFEKKFTLGFLRYLKSHEWHPEKMKLSREVITHSAFAVSLFVR
jgi:hypothetical protein